MIDRLKRLKRRNSYKVHILNKRNLLRLVVRQSNSNIHAQIIDDLKQKTLLFIATEMEIFEKAAIELNKKNVICKSYNVEGAKLIGSLIAKEALKLNIKEVIFDRGPFLYHPTGRIASLADSARKEGLKI